MKNIWFDYICRKHFKYIFQSMKWKILGLLKWKEGKQLIPGNVTVPFALIVMLCYILTYFFSLFFTFFVPFLLLLLYSSVSLFLYYLSSTFCYDVNVVFFILLKGTQD
jgi:hypothetical protein